MRKRNPSRTQHKRRGQPSGNRLFGWMALRAIYVSVFLLFCINGVYLYSLIDRVRRNGDVANTGTIERPSRSVDQGQAIKVEVLNGAGTSGIARRMTAYLRQKGFDVIHYGNAEHFAFYETVILDRVGDRLQAQRVAHVTGAGAVLEQKNPYLAVDVTMILGRDFERLSPFSMEGETDDQ